MRPVAWSSRVSYLGVSESGWPLRRPKLRSTSYSSREASTARANGSVVAGWLVTETRQRGGGLVGDGDAAAWWRAGW